MTRKRLTIGAAVVVIVLLFFVAGLGFAQGNGPVDASPEAAMRVESVIGTSFTYQGRLMDNGHPANGRYDFVFKLYSSSNGGSQIGSSVTASNLDVRNGLFRVVLNFGASAFQGEGRWLEIFVRRHGSGPYIRLVPRQPIYAVPYALSLRSGAVIRDDTSSVALNAFYRLPPPTSLSWKYGIEASSNGSATNTTYIGVGGRGRDIGVYGESPSANGYGGKFVNTASGGVALYARAKENSDVDLVLGGTSNTRDDGVISSDPTYSSSDIVLRSNDEVRIDLDADGDGEDADFVIRDKNGHLLFDVDESGAVISALPRPAYDSGWQTISQGQTKVFSHNLGGNPDNYVVDMTCKSDNATFGINQLYFGGDGRDGARYGAYWRHLTSTSITVYRFSNDAHCDQVRVRIWVYR